MIFVTLVCAELGTFCKVLDTPLYRFTIIVLMMLQLCCTFYLPGNSISVQNTVSILNEVQSKLNRAAFHLTASAPKPYLSSYIFAGQDIWYMDGFWSCHFVLIKNLFKKFQVRSV